MPYKVLKKGTLLIPSGTAYNPGKDHLFVICTDACAEDKHLIVPIATWRNDLCDATCRLVAGEHRFITHASYMLYRKSRIEPAAALVKGVDQNIFTPLDPMNGQTFLRVVNGICHSSQTPKKIKQYKGCPSRDPKA